MDNSGEPLQITVNNLIKRVKRTGVYMRCSEQPADRRVGLMPLAIGIRQEGQAKPGYDSASRQGGGKSGSLKWKSHIVNTHNMRRHTNRYIAERSFSYNNRDYADITRMRLATAGAHGRRITWNELVTPQAA